MPRDMHKIAVLHLQGDYQRGISWKLTTFQQNKFEKIEQKEEVGVP